MLLFLYQYLKMLKMIKHDFLLKTFLLCLNLKKYFYIRFLILGSLLKELKFDELLFLHFHLKFLMIYLLKIEINYLRLILLFEILLLFLICHSHLMHFLKFESEDLETCLTLFFCFLNEKNIYF